jgi:hypothetical protein
MNALSYNEVLRMKIRGMNPRQRDRIGRRQVDHRISCAVIADPTFQRRPVCVAVIVHVDYVMLARRAADSLVALVEIVDHVQA